MVPTLIDEAVYNRLSYKHSIRDPKDVRMNGKYGEALDYKDFAVLPAAVGSTLVWHDFGVMPNFPLEVFLGADMLAPHLCTILYFTHNKMQL